MFLNFKTSVKFSTFLLFIGQIAFGQSENRQIIPGTKCSLVPPAGFTAATTFAGFQSIETGASIMVNELPAPYSKLAEGFTVEAAKSRGMVVSKKETIDFQGAKATLISISQQANGMKYLKKMLLFGDETKSVMVNGIYPETATDIEEAITKAVLSTLYDDKQEENSLDAVPFSIDVSGTPFVLVKYLSGSLLYSADGKIPTEKPTLIVGNSLGKIPITNQKAFAEERLRKLPGAAKSTIISNKEITIDGMSGHEILANDITKEGLKELVHQTMLFDEDGNYFIIIGQTTEELEAYTDTFRKIANSFKRK